MTSGVTDTPGSERPPAVGELAWHTFGADQVLHSEGVDEQRGLSSAEAAARAERFGLNKFAAGRAESRWHAFLRQYRDPMQLVLVVAGIGSLYPLKQLGTGILLILLILLGDVEDGGAEEGDDVAQQAVGTLSVISWAEQAHGLAIARTMGMVTFALFVLFFSIESKDQRDSAFSLDTFSDKTFVITTSGSFVLLVLSTVLGIFQTVMKTVRLDVRQWLICAAVALSVVAAAEIRKAVLRLGKPFPVPDSAGQELVQAPGYWPCAIGTVGDHGAGEGRSRVVHAPE